MCLHALSEKRQRRKCGEVPTRERGVRALKPPSHCPDNRRSTWQLSSGIVLWHRSSVLIWGPFGLGSSTQPSTLAAACSYGAAPL